MIQDHVRESVHRPVFRAILFLLPTIGAIVSPLSAAGTCAPAEVLSPNAVVHRFVPDAEPEIYELMLDAPGVLWLHAAAPVAGPGRARLVLLGPACDDGLEARLRRDDDGAVSSRLARTPRGARLRVLSPGLVRFAVAPEDPAAPLVSYKLSTVFAPTPEPGSVPQKEVDPWEDDEVSGLTSCENVVDDHADDPLCATPLFPGEAVPGTIDSDRDDDYFAFLVGEWTTVAVDLTGGEEILGVLYGADGQELASWPAGRLVRTLGPGRYNVRVGSTGAWGGGYTVAVSDVP